VNYVIGGVIGLAWGGLIGLIKYLFFWRPILKNDKKTEITTKKLMIRYGLNVFFDFFALFLPFLLKQYLPFSFESVLIGTALSLVLLNKWNSLSKAKIASLDIKE